MGLGPLELAIIPAKIPEEDNAASMAADAFCRLSVGCGLGVTVTVMETE